MQRVARRESLSGRFPDWLSPLHTCRPLVYSRPPTDFLDCTLTGRQHIKALNVVLQSNPSTANKFPQHFSMRLTLILPPFEYFIGHLIRKTGVEREGCEFLSADIAFPQRQYFRMINLPFNVQNGFEQIGGAFEITGPLGRVWGQHSR